MKAAVIYRRTFCQLVSLKLTGENGHYSSHLAVSQIASSLGHSHGGRSSNIQHNQMRAKNKQTNKKAVTTVLRDLLCLVSQAVCLFLVRPNAEILTDRARAAMCSPHREPLGYLYRQHVVRRGNASSIRLSSLA